MKYEYLFKVVQINPMPLGQPDLQTYFNLDSEIIITKFEKDLFTQK